MARITVVRRQLGRRLQRLREAAGLTIAQVSAENLGSQTKIWRIENGRVEVNKPTVLALASLYQASKDETRALVDLALGTGQLGWWQEHGDNAVPEWFQLFVDLEARAASILAWDTELIPGPFQTADYARAVFRAATAPGDGRSIERQVQIRLERQRRLFGRTPRPRLSVVLGEGALARLTGGPNVMAAQVAHLRELGGQEKTEIRFLPFAAGAHAAMTGPFRILTFDDGDDPDFVYLEAQAGAQYREKQEELDRYQATFEMIREQSIPIGEYQCTSVRG